MQQGRPKGQRKNKQLQPKKLMSTRSAEGCGRRDSWHAIRYGMSRSAHLLYPHAKIQGAPSPPRRGLVPRSHTHKHTACCDKRFCIGQQASATTDAAVANIYHSRTMYLRWDGGMGDGVECRSRSHVLNSCPHDGYLPCLQLRWEAQDAN